MIALVQECLQCGHLCTSAVALQQTTVLLFPCGNNDLRNCTNALISWFSRVLALSIALI